MNIENLEILCSDNGNMFECDAKTFELVLLERLFFFGFNERWDFSEFPTSTLIVYSLFILFK